jgi:hypothetical protein
MSSPDETSEEKLDYASPDTKPAATGRPVRVWIKLLLVWGVGLIVWAMYLIALGYLILRIV